MYAGLRQISTRPRQFHPRTKIRCSSYFTAFQFHYMKRLLVCLTFFLYVFLLLFLSRWKFSHIKEYPYHYEMRRYFVRYTSKKNITENENFCLDLITPTIGNLTGLVITYNLVSYTYIFLWLNTFRITIYASKVIYLKLLIDVTFILVILARHNPMISCLYHFKWILIF